jgi:hypothetical protein
MRHPSRHRGPWWAALLLATFVSPVATGVEAAHGASAAASACPSTGTGGPFLRVCSSNVFSGKAGIGANAVVSLPCSTKDFVVRTVTSYNGTVSTTTDEGYVYFAFYAPGDEVEIGFSHNVQLGKNAYSLYVRHGNANQSFWNFDPSQAIACGSSVDLEATIAVKPGSVAVQVIDHVEGQGNGDIYTFEPHPGQSLERPNEIPVSSAGGSSPVSGPPLYPAGKGGILPLSPAAWSGCGQCSVAMLTAIAQNGPNGVTPTTPLADGATFGPVTWGNLYLIVGSSPTVWTKARTGDVVTWEKDHATIDFHGDPPGYTVTSVTVPCKAPPKKSADKWSCGNGIVYAK